MDYICRSSLSCACLPSSGLAVTSEETPKTPSLLLVPHIYACICPLLQMRIRKITPKILQLLTEWTETFPYDFRDERMMRSLKELTHRLASGDEVSPPQMSWTNVNPTVLFFFKKKSACSNTTGSEKAVFFMPTTLFEGYLSSKSDLLGNKVAQGG